MFYFGLDARNYLREMWKKDCVKDFNPYEKGAICESRIIENPIYQSKTKEEKKDGFYVDWNGKHKEKWIVHVLVMPTKNTGTFIYGCKQDQYLIYCDGMENRWKYLKAIMKSVRIDELGGALLRYNGRSQIIVGGIGGDYMNNSFRGELKAEGFHNRVGYLFQQAFSELTIKIDHKMKLC